MFINTKNENFKKYWLASVQPFFESQKFEQQILKTLKYFKVSMKSKLKSPKIDFTA